MTPRPLSLPPPSLPQRASCPLPPAAVPSHWARAESPSALESSEKSPRSGTAPAWVSGCRVVLPRLVRRGWGNSPPPTPRLEARCKGREKEGLVASNLNLKPGECLRVRGEVAPDAKSFVLNLGKDSDNLCLHFNPRFNMHGDANTIVCNSKDGGAWGTEQRESAFPFQPGSVMEVCISFDKADLTITLPDGYSFKFPNRLNLEAVNYLSANGDFKIKCVAFE
uniref:Galectin n=1 Tax=Equus caballus TaxID=9796 RepID=A0A9L0STW5_HORSE